MEERLREPLPCPFCGGDGKFNDLGSGRYHVHCKKCSGQWGEVWGAEESAEETVLGWNTRATDPLLEKMAEAATHLLANPEGVEEWQELAIVLQEYREMKDAHFSHEQKPAG